MYLNYYYTELKILHIVYSAVDTYEAIEATVSIKFVDTLKIAVHTVFFNKSRILMISKMINHLNILPKQASIYLKSSKIRWRLPRWGAFDAPLTP